MIPPIRTASAAFVTVASLGAVLLTASTPTVVGAWSSAASSSSWLSTPPSHHHHRASRLSSSTALNLSGGGTSDESSSSKKAIVVGGGPVGLAAAMVLASDPHNYHVDVFEASGTSVGGNSGSRGSGAPAEYDPTKAFLYNINARGQTLAARFPSIKLLLKERGVDGGGAGAQGAVLYTVPSDPEESIASRSISMGGPKKKAEDDNNESKNGNAIAAALSKPNPETSYWIPRHEMVGLMHDSIKMEGLADKIAYHSGQECVAVRPTGVLGREEVEVVLATRSSAEEDATTTTSSHRASLVVGADGMNSRVRECLASVNADDFCNAHWGLSNVNGQTTKVHQPKKFRPKKYISPASNLRVKVLQFPPRFTVPNATSAVMETSSEMFLAIRSLKTNPRDYLSLGLLPMKNNDAPRPTNIITRPDHHVWKLTDGPSVKAYFDAQYPRFRFVDHDDSTSSPSTNKNDGTTVKISDAEWDRFAKAQGVRFPPCQDSPGLAVHSPSGNAGVVLAGDAAHAYPPDIGQGINSGLADVVALDRALRGFEDVSPQAATVKYEKEGDATATDGAATTTTLDAALSRYQTQREPELRALIRLARFGSPYQYRQPHRIDRIRRVLWTANVALRMLLNKITAGVVAKPCIVMAMDGGLTFREVMRRADLTTVGLMGVVGAMVGRMFWKRFATMMVVV